MRISEEMDVGRMLRSGCSANDKVRSCSYRNLRIVVSDEIAQTVDVKNIMLFRGCYCRHSDDEVVGERQSSVRSVGRDAPIRSEFVTSDIRARRFQQVHRSTT